jgi:hypothetical protein
LDFAKAENLRINTVDYQNFRPVTVQERIEPRRGQCNLFSEPPETFFFSPCHGLEFTFTEYCN